jgi:hypothetical protein
MTACSHRAFDVIVPKGLLEAAFGLVMPGLAVLLTWKMLVLMMVGLRKRSAAR